MKKNKKRINTSKVVIIFSLILIVVIVLYTSLNSGIFNSDNIEIEGNKYVESEYIIKALEVNNNKNIFRYNIKDMEEILLNNKYIDKVEIKIHPPQRKIVILKCEHEVFLITDDDLFDHVRSGEVLYMKITEYARVIYIKDKVVNKEVNRIEYDFSQPRFKEDDGIYNEFDIFKHGNDKII